MLYNKSMKQSNTQVEYKITDKFTPEVISEILEVQETKGLTAKNLLNKAKSKKSKLHNLFNWNNDSAAELWRLQQARILINKVEVIIKDKKMFAFENVNVVVNGVESVNFNEDYSYKREYKPIGEILSSENLREQLISRAISEVDYWKNRYLEINEFYPIFDSIEKVKTKWQKKKQ